VVPSEAVFVDAMIRERTQRPPGAEAAAELGLPEGVDPPDRWQLRTIRASIPALAGYSLSGVWRACRRAKIHLRTARPRLYSPDPAYAEKRDQLLAALGEVAAEPDQVVVVFLDEMSYLRWPQPARTFAHKAPVAPPRTRPHGKEAKHRIAGMLDAWSGRVLFIDSTVVGRERLLALYRQLEKAYPSAKRIYVVQDNWPIHAHSDLDALLTTLPRIQRLWLPTAAWWLNPIEKLWRKLRQEVLRLHPRSHDWLGLRHAVRKYLRQFATGSTELLRYVGLLGDGPLARALHPAPTTHLHCQK
jgi:transposase